LVQYINKHNASKCRSNQEKEQNFSSYYIIQIQLKRTQLFKMNKSWIFNKTHKQFEIKTLGTQNKRARWGVTGNVGEKWGFSRSCWNGWMKIIVIAAAAYERKALGVSNKCLVLCVCETQFTCAWDVQCNYTLTRAEDKAR